MPMAEADPIEFDRRGRVSVYRHFVTRGKAPTLAETAAAAGAPSDAVRASLERLAAAHILVLDPQTRHIWMAMPFSAVPTGFRVRTDRGDWWANCAWDALGISAMLQAPAEITTSCSDCGAPPPVRTDGRALTHGAGVVHFAVPASEWWDDIGFT
ncbi:MAG TPA: organomercurial lyase [Gemmatimonadales bacterium]|nr:organomercurial lyase [Gemmatimonadales bacterium]